MFCSSSSLCGRPCAAVDLCECCPYCGFIFGVCRAGDRPAGPPVCCPVIGPGDQLAELVHAHFAVIHFVILSGPVGLRGVVLFFMILLYIIL